MNYNKYLPSIYTFKTIQLYYLQLVVLFKKNFILYKLTKLLTTQHIHYVPICD